MAHGETQSAPPPPRISSAPPPPSCNHGISFDVNAAKVLDSRLVRLRWPRLTGVCPLGCGYNGTYYASKAHYVYGDW